MGETSLRAQLELAVSAEPPLGHLVSNSLQAGRKLRRRRRAIGAASLSAVAVVLVGAVPVLTAGGTNRHGGRPHPAASEQAPETGTAFVATGVSTVVPISLATNTPGTPIQVPEGTDGPFITNSAVSANRQTIYEVGERVVDQAGRPGPLATTVTPIDTTTDVAGRTITVRGATNPLDFALAPDGKTAYLRRRRRGSFPGQPRHARCKRGDRMQPVRLQGLRAHAER